MRAEIVAVGSELLLGQITDTNSSWLGSRLAEAGIDCHRQTKVGDNHARIVTVLTEALGRADAVIVCGGLGPTQDDITRAAIAEVMGVGLELDDEVAARIEARFSDRGRRMSANNLTQAEVPEGATAIADPQPGTAPGLICPVGDDQVIYAVPGVPHELVEIVDGAVLPDLRARAGETATTIVSRTLRTWGESESGLAERLGARLRALDSAGNPTLAFLASGIEGIKVRITARGADAAACARVLDGEEARLREALGPLVFGVDDETMEATVGRRLDARGWTLGLAESVTGGLIGARCTDVAGASAWFRGSIVSYAAEVKHALLAVGEGPVVSAAAAEAMATGARRALGATVGLAVTGVAGPEPQDGYDPGNVFVGLDVDGTVRSAHLRLPGDRARVRQFTAISALDLLRHHLDATGADHPLAGTFGT